jgi:hypothetical protein
MNDIPTDATETPGGADAPAEARPAKPDAVPDKFWDEAAGAVRVEALAKSYGELERKLGGLAGRGVPESAEAYEIDPGDGPIGPDAQVNARLQEAGFTQDQARLVYELANQYLPGLVGEMAGAFEARNQVDRLERHYGGPERWRETARQLATWGRDKLPAEVFEALSCTYEGVLALERMMDSGEPPLGAAGESAVPGLSEGDLRAMMRDPRYWRERDPAVVAKVRDGFRRLFPGRG